MLLDCLLGRVGLSERLLGFVLTCLIHVRGQLLNFDRSFVRLLLIKADDLQLIWLGLITALNDGG